MARATSRFSRWRQQLAAYRWRRVGVLAGISLALSLALVLYLFGAGNQFFSRLFSAFLVGFWLLAITFLGIIPFIGWAAAHWFGRGWQGETPQPARSRPARPASAARAASPS